MDETSVSNVLVFSLYKMFCVFLKLHPLSSLFCALSRATSRSRKPWRLVYDSLRLASRLALVSTAAA